MSKKLNKLVLLSALMIAIIGTFGTVSAEEYNLTTDGELVGVVEVTEDENNLTVTYKITEDGWCLNETHLHIATLVSEIPQTKKGNPIPGHFDYSEEHACITEYTYTIPITWDPETEVIIAAHAAVQPVIEVSSIDDEVLRETVWGEGEDFPGRNWAMYFTYPSTAPLTPLSNTE